MIIIIFIEINYKFKKITVKNISIQGFFNCLAKGVKILDGMKCSTLFAPILGSLQSNQVMRTPQEYINEFIIQKLNLLLVVDFRLISAFLYV